MNILVIDYLSPKGHITFNSIHINALKSLGSQLHLMGRQGLYEEYVGCKNVKITYIPEKFFKLYPIPKISERIKGILCLWWVQRNVRLSSYDKIIFLSYDIISLFFFKIPQMAFLINHNNVDQLDNSIKLYLTRNMTNNFCHIAINKYMENRLKELLPQRNVYYIPHGILPPSLCMERPSFVSKNEKFIFCPVNRNYDENLINILINEEFNRYLQKNQLFLYVKKQLLNSYISYSNIHVVDILDNEEYNYMLSKSKAVILPYGAGFKYRCSGIMFECVARKTPIIASRIDALEAFKGEINISFFSNKDELITAINNLSVIPLFNYDTDIFNPKKYWEKVL